MGMFGHEKIDEEFLELEVALLNEHMENIVENDYTDSSIGE
jgi:hypothetical protein